MKKINAKKLVLSRETLVRMDGQKLAFAVGGAWSEDSVCPTGPSGVCSRVETGETDAG